MRRIMLVASVLLCVFLTQRTHAATVPECPDTGTVTSSCVMSHDHLEPIRIFAENVTLDCRGHQVSGRGSLGDGITVNGFTGVRIKNCTASGWDIGIRVDNVPGAVYLNDNAVVNNHTGFSINGTRTIYLSGGSVAFNSDDGIDLVNDVFVSISRVAILRNTDKGITYKNTLTANNLRLNVIENRISNNDTGVSVQAVTTRGMICGNGFWMNKKSVFSNVAAVTMPDNKTADDFGVCTVD